MAGEPIAQLIDAMIASEKTLGGSPDWRSAGNNAGEWRLRIPLFIEGESCGVDVEINAYPDSGTNHFRIMLNAEKCIWRIDFNHFETHQNPQDSWGAYGVRFREPHFHSWAANRRYATHSSLPAKLKIAQPLPTTIRQFDTVFRWFCGEVNIVQPPVNMITLPGRTRLI